MASRQSIRITVRVQPRASRNEIAGMYGDALKVRLTTPPVDGAANAALIELLADRLGVSRAAVSIISGHAGRTKIVEVAGIRAADVRQLTKSASARSDSG